MQYSEHYTSTKEAMNAWVYWFGDGNGILFLFCFFSISLERQENYYNGLNIFETSWIIFSATSNFVKIYKAFPVERNSEWLRISFFTSALEEKSIFGTNFRNVWEIFYSFGQMFMLFRSILLTICSKCPWFQSGKKFSGHFVRIMVFCSKCSKYS